MLPTPLNRVPTDAQQELKVRKGEAIFHQGETTGGVFYVVRGRAELRRHTESGVQVVIHRAGAGETFAEASLFSGAYHCDAVALDDTVVVRLAKQAVLEQFSSDPEFALSLAGRFAVQVQFYRRRIELLAIRSAEDRVFSALTDRPVVGSIMSFASEIGLTHEATYRALAMLVRKGKVRKFGRGEYSIL
jgi:CRP-like cAMP-binding protein